MKNIRLMSYCFLVFLTFLTACAPPQAMGMQLANEQLTATPSPTYVTADLNATPTPTPFQPLPPTPMAIPTEVVIEAPTETPTPQITLPLEGMPEVSLDGLPKKQINILLLGTDARPRSTNFRTDTIILLTLNPELGRVNLTSFPRDLYVTLPGWGMNRINTAWVYGGYKMLSNTFKHNFGIKPDYYVLVNFSSFKYIVDTLGGLDVNVGVPLSDYRAGYWTNIPKGTVHMDADTVLWYVRSRKTSNDIARNRRQQEVLYAIFVKMLSMDGIRRAPEFYEIFKDSVKTDLPWTEMITWLPLAAKMAEEPNIKHYFITYKHVYDWITPEGAMVLLPNQQAVMQVIRKSQNMP
jgi:LCP family protein required for cell wall assembly